MRKIGKAMKNFSFLTSKKQRVGFGTDHPVRSRALRVEALEPRRVLSLLVGSAVADLSKPDVHALNITLPNPEYHFVDSGNGMQQIVSEELSGGGESGNPELPGQLLRLLLPSDAVLSSLTIQAMSSSERTLPGSHHLQPVESLVADSADGTLIYDYPQSAQIVDGKNMLVYGQDAFYGMGTITLGGTEQMGRYKYVNVYYSPFSCNPVTGDVKLALDVEFTLNYRTGDPESAALLARSFGAEEAADMFANYADASAWYPSVSPEPAGASGSASYAIITTSAIASGSVRLADFVTQKQADGFSVQVFTESEWGGGTGDTAAEHIRSWLQANYASLGIQYVMLIGNPNPTSGDVPMKMTYPRSSSSDDRESPTDYYYADLTSNWNSDGDSMYGEFGTLLGGGDFSPWTSLPVHEVYVGRVPVYNADYAALDGILMKTINYERESNIAWRKNVLLPMAISNYEDEDGENKDPTDGSSLGEKIKNDLATPNSFGAYTLYEKAGLDPVSTACDAPISKTNVLNAWTTNAYGIVDWWAHGGQESASRKYWSADSDSDGVPDGNEMTWADFIVSSDAAQLNNSRPSIVTEVSCQNAWPENSNNLGYSLLKNGAIGTYSGTRNTWYTYGPWSATTRGDNASYAYYITKRLVQNQTTETLGAALQWCRENLSTGLSGSATYFMNRTDFNLYGDPSIKPFVAGAEAPEMDVLGNSKNILDGDAAPSAADATDFGSVNVNSYTASRTFTIKNNGNGALNLSGSPRVVISGANAADFTVITQPTSSVAAGGSTTFTVRFDPSDMGLRTAAIGIVNDDSNESVYDFAIQGTGVAPEINLKGNGLDILDGDTTPSTADFTDFGSMNVASGTVSKTFYVWNTGGVYLSLNGNPKVAVSGVNASDFTVTTQPATNLNPGVSSSFTIRFDPSGIGTRTATVSISSTDLDENPYDFVIQGTGLASEINLQGNSLDIADGDTTPDVADNTDFGSVNNLAGSQSYTFTIQNIGNDVLTLGGTPLVEIVGANAVDFIVTAQPASSTIASAGSLTFTVQFDPNDAGLRTATVRITNNDSDENPYDFAIQGMGLASEINLQGNSIDIADGDTTPDVADNTDFGSVNILAGSQSYSFTIQNIGNDALTLGGTPLVEITGANAADFTVTAQPSNSTIAAAGSLTFTVQFDPSDAGLRTATVRIANNDSDENPYDFAIQGTGLATEINLQGNSIDIADGDTTPDVADDTDFGSIDILAGTQSYTFTIQNVGNGDLTLDGTPLVEIVGANAADFTVTAQPTNSTIAAGGSLTFTVQFDPSDAGLRTATVRITNNDADESSYDFAIQGTGIVVEKTFTWDGGGTDAFWTTAENWVGDVAPTPGDKLAFPAGADKSASANDYPPGTIFDSIEVAGENYHFQNGIASSGTVQVSSGTLTTTSIVCDTLIIGGQPQAVASKSPASVVADDVAIAPASPAAVDPSRLGLPRTDPMPKTVSSANAAIAIGEVELPAVELPIAPSRDWVASAIQVTLASGPTAPIAPQPLETATVDPSPTAVFANAFRASEVISRMSSGSLDSFAGSTLAKEDSKRSEYRDNFDSSAASSRQTLLASSLVRSAHKLAVQSLVEESRRKPPLEPADAELLAIELLRERAGLDAVADAKLAKSIA